MREPKDIEEQSATSADYNVAMRKALIRDTRIAQWGMVLITVGFMNQLFGNLG